MGNSFVFLRVVGNYGLIVNTIFGQFFDMRLALVISLLLSLISIPYYAKHRLWDTVLFIAFIMSINLASVLNGVPGCRDL
jgi:hypothetical protein